MPFPLSQRERGTGGEDSGAKGGSRDKARTGIGVVKVLRVGGEVTAPARRSGCQSGGIRPFSSASATPFVHPNPSCVGYSPPPARRCTSTTSYFSVILPVAR